MSPEEQIKPEEYRGLRPRRALLVTPTSTKAMAVGGGVAKVINTKGIIYIRTYIHFEYKYCMNITFYIQTHNSIFRPTRYSLKDWKSRGFKWSFAAHGQT